VDSIFALAFATAGSHNACQIQTCANRPLVAGVSLVLTFARTLAAV
jgi:hypothetical protein